MKFKSVMTACVAGFAAVSANAGLFGSSDGMKADCSAKHSRAWCALDAAQMSKGVRDFSKAKYYEGMGDRDGSKLVGNAVGGISTANGAFKVAAGLTKGFELGVLAVDVFLPDKAPVVGKNVVFGWMPYEMAATAEEAQAKLHEVLLASTMEALKPYRVEDAVSGVFPFSQEAYSISRVDQKGYLITGGDCGERKCMLTQMRPGGLSAYVTGMKGEEGTAPEWLGGYKAWVFNLRNAPSILELVVDGEYASNRYAEALSKQLPKWAFLSMSPQSSLFGRRMNAGQVMPLVMNAGNTLAPIYPEIETGADGTKVSSSK